jgi:hypothetical protein
MFSTPETSAPADRVAGIHAPWNATVGECLQRWAELGPIERSRTYLVLRGDEGARRTLNSSAIAELALRAIFERAESAGIHTGAVF